MTRINCVDPEILHDKHLLAEYRELPRIFTLVKKALEGKGELPCHTQSDQYVLGTGHMKFFYTRCGYLLKRQKQLIAECKRRGIQVQFTDPDSLVIGIPKYCMHDWEPDGKAIALNLARIFERLEQMETKANEY